MNAIELKEISKSFGNKKVLNHISFTIEEHEIFGLLGPSGAGKTTLIKILTGQFMPSEGESFVFGENSRKLKENNYREIGMVMDNSGLYDRLSCYDNLRLFADIYDIEETCIIEVLEQVGLQKARKTPAGKLSKGMKQRLVLARAILHKPRLLFLDEPTSGLDPAATKSIHELLYNLKEKGTTIFLTTHNMEEAAKMCNRIALLHEGEIVEQGKPEELCRKYNTQNQITIIKKDNQMISFINDVDNAAKIGKMFEQGEIVSIHSSEPNLEQVFLTLTGKSLQTLER